MKYQGILAAMIVLIPTISYAQDVCINSYAATVCGEGVVASVTANGLASLTGTLVSEKAQINGTLQANHAEITALSVSGIANLINCNMVQPTQVNGILNAKKSNFKESLLLASNQSSLEECTTKNILISGINTPQLKLTLINTTVNGDIHFSGANGVVYLCNGSRVAGNIIGGEINENC